MSSFAEDFPFCKSGYLGLKQLRSQMSSFAAEYFLKKWTFRTTADLVLNVQFCRKQTAVSVRLNSLCCRVRESHFDYLTPHHQTTYSWTYWLDCSL